MGRVDRKNDIKIFQDLEAGGLESASKTAYKRTALAERWILHPSSS
jgi:hypothetical protein